MGKRELCKTIPQCVARETEEETGVRVEVTGLLGIQSAPATSNYWSAQARVQAC